MQSQIVCLCLSVLGSWELLKLLFSLDFVCRAFRFPLKFRNIVINVIIFPCTSPSFFLVVFIFIHFDSIYSYFYFLWKWNAKRSKNECCNVLQCGNINMVYIWFQIERSPCFSSFLRKSVAKLTFFLLNWNLLLLTNAALQYFTWRFKW